MASMATSDSSDSNLLQEQGNEVCDIINYVSRKLRFLEALKDTVVCLLFKPYS